MTASVDRPTRVASDLLDSAAAEGARQSRSAKQQLDHWARVGRAVSGQQSVSRQRVEAALSGRLDLRELSVEEGVVFNAEIEVAVEQSLATVDLQKVLQNKGVRLVGVDENGNLVEYPSA